MIVSFVYATVFTLLLITTCSSRSSNKIPPNIIFFLVDDLGWNDVSFHGSNQIPTPNLDRLAANGVTLDNYYVNPVCSPTRGSIMTGRSMMHTGIQTPYGAGDDASGLNLTYTLLPEQLKIKFNYTSYMIGKWHLGMKSKEYLPSSRGFCKYFGYYLGCTDYWKHYGDLDDNGEIAVELHQGGSLLGLKPGFDLPLYNTSGKYSTSLYADIASEWIQQHDQRYPMFMYLAFQGAHSANNKFVQAPADLLSRPNINKISPLYTCGQWEIPQTGECTKAAMRKTIAATVVAVDEAVYQIETTLKNVGMWNNTLIVFSTDNGGPTDGTNNNMMNNYPLRSGKGETFEGGIRAVGFIHGKGLQSKVIGTISKQLHHVSDWYLTLLDAAAAGNGGSTSSVVPKLKPNERPFIDGDGMSNWNALSTGAPSKRNEIFIAGQAEGSKLKAKAIRINEWKLIYHPQLLYNMPGWYLPPNKNYNTYSKNLTEQCGGPPPNLSSTDKCDLNWCLFNLKNDPCEYKNVALSNPNIVNMLKARLIELSKTTVLTWVNFSDKDPLSNPTNFGPKTPIIPDPQKNIGPHIYEGVWKPWLNETQASKTYPASYSGPGYPL